MEKICVLVNKEFRGRVFGEKYYDRLRKMGEVKVYDRDDFSDEAYYLDFVKGSTVIVTSWDSPKIDVEILDACPDLKAVIHAAGSVKPVVSDAFIERKIRITNSAVAIGEGVAESALGFAISACKGFYQLFSCFVSIFSIRIPMTSPGARQYNSCICFFYKLFQYYQTGNVNISFVFFSVNVITT